MGFIRKCQWRIFKQIHFCFYLVYSDCKIPLIVILMSNYKDVKREKEIHLRIIEMEFLKTLCKLKCFIFFLFSFVEGIFLATVLFNYN